jgi:hypothetical protein
LPHDASKRCGCPAFAGHDTESVSAVQLHLESKTGIGQGYLSDLENGRRTETPETIRKLAEALNVPTEWHS